jgi:site-specific recombinase XerD
VETEKDFIAIITCYIDYLDLKPITKNSYKKILINYSNYLLKKKITRPTRTDIVNYKEYLKTKVKSASIQKTIVVIRNFYRWYSINGYGVNIAEGIKGVKIESTFKRESLTVEEAKKLLLRCKNSSTKSLEGKRNYAIIALLITTGLRTIEIERADVVDLNIVEGTHVLYIQGKGHDDKDDYVKLSQEVYSIIENYLIERNDNFEPLFINHARCSVNTRIKTRTIREVVKESLRMIGLDSKVYSAHSLRHSCATLNLLNGGSLEETKQMLRHKDISTTIIYSHHLARTQNNSELRVSEVLFDNQKKNKRK